MSLSPVMLFNGPLASKPIDSFLSFFSEPGPTLGGDAMVPVHHRQREGNKIRRTVTKSPRLRCTKAIYLFIIRDPGFA